MIFSKSLSATIALEAADANEDTGVWAAICRFFSKSDSPLVSSVHRLGTVFSELEIDNAMRLATEKGLIFIDHHGLSNDLPDLLKALEKGGSHIKGAEKFYILMEDAVQDLVLTYDACITQMSDQQAQIDILISGVPQTPSTFDTANFQEQLKAFDFESFLDECRGHFDEQCQRFEAIFTPHFPKTSLTQTEDYIAAVDTTVHSRPAYHRNFSGKRNTVYPPYINQKYKMGNDYAYCYHGMDPFDMMFIMMLMDDSHSHHPELQHYDSHGETISAEHFDSHEQHFVESDFNSESYVNTLSEASSQEAMSGYESLNTYSHSEEAHSSPPAESVSNDYGWPDSSSSVVSDSSSNISSDSGSSSPSCGGSSSPSCGGSSGGGGGCGGGGCGGA